MTIQGKYDYNFEGKVVLVVEDNMISFQLISAVLHKVKAEVVHATNGRIAIEMCSGDSHFDLILMDMQMPEVDGLQATREIKKIHPELPVIAVTANAFDGEKFAFESAGCDAFLTKPLQFRQLFELMSSILDR